MPSQDPGLQTAASVEQAISGNAAVAKAMLAAVQELVACQASLLEIVEGLTHELDAVASQVAAIEHELRHAPAAPDAAIVDATAAEAAESVVPLRSVAG